MTNIDDGENDRQMAGFITFPVMFTLASSMFLGGAFITTQEPMLDLELPAIEEVSQEAQVLLALGENNETELLWFARAIYSETKRPDEQVLVAWVIRNRLEYGYWGDTYEDVVLARGQFSGLNSFEKNYEYNISKGNHSTNEAWINAVKIAESVYYSDEALRPFPETVMHFYSPISVNYSPKWAQGRKAIITIRDPDTEKVRFAFYDKIM